MAGPVEISVDTTDFVRLGRAMRAEADGKALRRDMIRNVRVAVRPAQAEAKAAVLALPSSGGPREGAPLRQAVARNVRTTVRLSGRSAGASIKVSKRGMPRGFKNAPRRLNRREGWRHPVYGRSSAPWVSQSIAPPGWFDLTLMKGRDRYRYAVELAALQMARRIASRTNRGS